MKHRMNIIAFEAILAEAKQMMQCKHMLECYTTEEYEYICMCHVLVENYIRDNKDE